MQDQVITHVALPIISVHAAVSTSHHSWYIPRQVPPLVGSSQDKWKEALEELREGLTIRLEHFQEEEQKKVVSINLVDQTNYKSIFFFK